MVRLVSFKAMGKRKVIGLACILLILFPKSNSLMWGKLIDKYADEFIHSFLCLNLYTSYL